ncbi:hypothetical protein TIFTF001_039140 [Ficus carica]|uniref:Protein kinase domain-containing protein n=1 Tax=Ficus carica TaxID=3494 RepID=A0AA88JDN2_FICCA|nr:hypothetical protein TIFTF001_039140 [Ficus carica]
MKKKILGKPGIYVEDFTSIYSLGENIGYNRYVCTEKATGIKYSCLRLEKKYFDDDDDDDDNDDDDDDDDDDDVDSVIRERLRRSVEIGEHMMKSKRQQYYPSNNNNSNILESKAAYVDNYYVYLVMELLSGDRLDEWIKAKEKELDDEEAAYLFWQVLNAIHAFHSMEVMLRTLDLSHFWFLPEYKGKLHIKYEIDLDAIFINEGNN